MRSFPSLVLVAVLAVCCVVSFAVADDWNLWRGPQHAGTNAGSFGKSWWSLSATTQPAPKDSPALLWQSADKIPGDGSFGFTSPVIAGGNVYQFLSWSYNEPIATRTLSEGGLRNLGWNNVKLPDELSAKVEAARVGEERAKMDPKKLDEAIKAWVAENVTKTLAADVKKETRDQYANIAFDRMKRGKDAVDLEVLAKLATVSNKPFATQADLDKWLDDNGIKDPLRKNVLGQVPTTVAKCNDTMMCLSGKDGSTLWKKEYPSSVQGWGSSSTPAVVGGKVIFGGASGMFCVSAKDGSAIWNDPATIACSSPCVVGETVYVVCKPKDKNWQLRAMNIADGKEVWNQPKVSGDCSSAVPWKDGSDQYLVINDGGQVKLISAKDGAIVWGVPGGGPSTAAVGDGFVVVETDNGKVGTLGYKLSKDKPEKAAWSVPVSDRGSSAIIWKGSAYVQGGGKVFCVDVATGNVAWQHQLPMGEFSTPCVVDGVLFVLGEGMFAISAGANDGKLLARLKLPYLRCISVAIADDKMVVRSPNNVACYDLSKVPQPPAPPTAGK